MEEYNFSVYTSGAKTGLYSALQNLIGAKENVVILCIGSDAVMGDALAPLAGTLLKEKYKITNYVYGTLSQTITAKEVVYAQDFIRAMHKNATILAIDAAVGRVDDIGLIKLRDSGILPGKGVDKDLKITGDCSLMGIVAEKSLASYTLLNLTRMNLIYKMADTIASALSDCLTLPQSKIKEYAEKLNSERINIQSA